MRYYILGGNNQKIRQKIKDCYLDTDNFGIAVAAFFNNVVDSKHAYLVVDFESFDSHGIFSNAFIDIKKGQIPFLIIGECHNGKLYTRSDTISIEGGGFVEEFSNNVEALKKFNSVKDSPVEYKLYLNIKCAVPGSDTKVCSKYILISNKNIMSNTIKKIIVDSPTWESNPSIVERRFTREDFYHPEDGSDDILIAN